MVIEDNPPLGKTLKGLRVPKGWRQQRYGPCGFVYRALGGLVVIESDGGQTPDGEWLHISLSYPDHIPNWTDLRLVKAALVGLDGDAIVVLPCQQEYVNIHPNCLHLWHRLDGESAPRFAREIAPGRFSI